MSLYGLELGVTVRITVGLVALGAIYPIAVGAYVLVRTKSTEQQCPGSYYLQSAGLVYVQASDCIL